MIESVLRRNSHSMAYPHLFYLAAIPALSSQTWDAVYDHILSWTKTTLVFVQPLRSLIPAVKITGAVPSFPILPDDELPPGTCSVGNQIGTYR
jgi:hypothetical protein